MTCGLVLSISITTFHFFGWNLFLHGRRSRQAGRQGTFDRRAAAAVLNSSICWFCASSLELSQLASRESSIFIPNSTHLLIIDTIVGSNARKSSMAFLFCKILSWWSSSECWCDLLLLGWPCKTSPCYLVKKVACQIGRHRCGYSSSRQALQILFRR